MLLGKLRLLAAFLFLACSVKVLLFPTPDPVFIHSMPDFICSPNAKLYLRII